MPGYRLRQMKVGGTLLPSGLTSDIPINLLVHLPWPYLFLCVCVIVTLVLEGHFISLSRPSL